MLQAVVPTPSRRYTVLPLKPLLAYKSEHAHFVYYTNVIHLTEAVGNSVGVGCLTSDQWACMLVGVCKATRVQSVVYMDNMVELQAVVPTPSRRYTVLPLKPLLAYKSEHAHFVYYTNLIQLTEAVGNSVGVGCPTSDQWACMLVGVCKATRVQSVVSIVNMVVLQAVVPTPSSRRATYRFNEYSIEYLQLIISLYVDILYNLVKIVYFAQHCCISMLGTFLCNLRNIDQFHQDSLACA